MDTSETYIKMSDCPEIQGLADRETKLNPKNYAYCPTHKNLVHMVNGEYECVECPVKWVKGDSIDGWIWLPRQDQLQEMLEGLNKLDLCFEANAGGHHNLRVNDPLSEFPIKTKFVLTGKSMEQLWLAFVMKEKYGKTWDGESWVKSK